MASKRVDPFARRFVRLRLLPMVTRSASPARASSTHPAVRLLGTLAAAGTSVARGTGGRAPPGGRQLPAPLACPRRPRTDPTTNLRSPPAGRPRPASRRARARERQADSVGCGTRRARGTVPSSTFAAGPARPRSGFRRRSSTRTRWPRRRAPACTPRATHRAPRACARHAQRRPGRPPSLPLRRFPHVTWFSDGVSFQGPGMRAKVHPSVSRCKNTR